jgi:hypothetical protein
MRSSVYFADETFAVSQGKVTKGEPDAAMLREIEAVRPKCLTVPDSLYWELRPGARRSQLIQLLNLTPQPLDLVAQLRPWEFDEAGKVIFPDSATHQRYLPRALSVAPSRITLRPMGQQSVTVTFVMPAAAEGEYYDALFFVPEGQPLTTDPDILAQQALMVTAAVPKTANPNLVIPEFGLKMLDSGGYQFDCAVENKGNAHCAVKGTIEVSLLGRKVDDLAFGGDAVALLPAGRRSFAVSWPRVLEPGKYQATATVRYGDGKVVTRDVRFEIR